MEMIRFTDNDTTVPIAIDAVKTIDGFYMSRCTYFSIENSEPAPGWTLETAGMSIRFMMVGLSGIVVSPPGVHDNFNSPLLFDQLFEVVESNPALFVDTNDIWLPNQVFSLLKTEPVRGEVYRVGQALFRAAYLLKGYAHTDKELWKRLSELDIPIHIEYSEAETQALLEWNESLISKIRANYHEHPDKKLRKKDGSQRPTPTLTR